MVSLIMRGTEPTVLEKSHGALLEHPNRDSAPPEGKRHSATGKEARFRTPFSAFFLFAYLGAYGHNPGAKSDAESGMPASSSESRLRSERTRQCLTLFPMIAPCAVPVKKNAPLTPSPRATRSTRSIPTNAQTAAPALKYARLTPSAKPTDTAEHSDREGEPSGPVRRSRHGAVSCPRLRRAFDKPTGL